MRRLINLASIFALAIGAAACDVSDESFEAGQWVVEGWMEADTSAQRISPQSDTVRISRDVARFNPKAVVFSEFYHGQAANDVVFSDGKISGHLNQAAVAPFPAHQQAVEGWYRADAFEMRIAMPKIAGVQAHQIVTGRLEKPLE